MMFFDTKATPINNIDCNYSKRKLESCITCLTGYCIFRVVVISNSVRVDIHTHTNTHCKQKHAI